jgi:hypothetical protein
MVEQAFHRDACPGEHGFTTEDFGILNDEVPHAAKLIHPADGGEQEISTLIERRYSNSKFRQDVVQRRAGTEGGVGFGFVGLVIATDVHGLALDGEELPFPRGDTFDFP